MGTRNNEDVARRIVAAIVTDLKKMQGLRAEWENMAPTSRVEIVDRWWELVCEQLEG